MTNFNTETAIALLDSVDDFPVSFDDAWRWLGYESKSDCSEKIKNYHMVSSVKYADGYSVKRFKKPEDSRYKHHIFLTVDAFRFLGGMTNTSQASRFESIILSVIDLPSRRKKYSHDSDS
jgi:hypothetical protein